MTQPQVPKICDPQEPISAFSCKTGILRPKFENKPQVKEYNGT